MKFVQVHDHCSSVNTGTVLDIADGSNPFFFTGAVFNLPSCSLPILQKLSQHVHTPPLQTSFTHHVGRQKIEYTRIHTTFSFYQKFIGLQLFILKQEERRRRLVVQDSQREVPTQTLMLSLMITTGRKSAGTETD